MAWTLKPRLHGPVTADALATFLRQDEALQDAAQLVGDATAHLWNEPAESPEVVRVSDLGAPVRGCVRVRFDGAYTLGVHGSPEQIASLARALMVGAERLRPVPPPATEAQALVEGAAVEREPETAAAGVGGGA